MIQKDKQAMNKQHNMLCQYQTKEGVIFPVLVVADGLLEGEAKARQIANFLSDDCRCILTYLVNDTDFTTLKSFIPKQQQGV
jgi:hypothetical protein